MFELPDSKRIRRADLNSHSSRSSSPTNSSNDFSPTSVDRAATLAHLQDSNPLHFETPPCPTPTTAFPSGITQETQDTANPTADDEETYAFKLFAPAKQAADTEIAHISLKAPERTTGGFLPSHRTSTPFFAPSPALLNSLHKSTISHSTLDTLAHQSRPGSAHPWRVTHLTLPASLQRKNVAHLSIPLQTTGDGEQSRKRCRKGKKTRIKIRVKLRKEEAKKRVEEKVRRKAQAEEEDKEKHLREKKTAANRRKQLKRRDKAREARGEKGGGEDEGSGGG